MVLYAGQIYRSNDVSIGPPDADAVRKAFKALDVGEWLSDALARVDVYYFSIFWNEALVGQILLHDIHIYSST